MNNNIQVIHSVIDNNEIEEDYQNEESLDGSSHDKNKLS